MPTTLPTRAEPAQRATMALWRLIVGFVLLRLSRYAFHFAERLCRAAERVARR